MYDVRENTWKLFEIGLSSPRRLMSIVSSQKDRVIIIGGKEKDNTNSKVVEEIDFLKRNLVNLAHLNQSRSQGSAFMVNDVIYVFGGESLPSSGDDIVEKYTLNENRWRIVKPQDLMKMGDCETAIKTFRAYSSGPSALLYE